ncbi:enolase C-terminal domain-like protein [Haloferax sp. ATB1]|uniref:enolase C-terminal domain-like protein n=1 Tax=Haloferax sp. ATB1 TaxID=1508454 RepID=UPI0005B217CE|nr:enolase C-terminal domain-like protein [Haloferax sp. ATB1]
MAPTITKIESIEFGYPLEDRAPSPEGFDLAYYPGETTTRHLYGLRIHTDEGITGEYVGGNSPAMAQVNTVADYLVGKNPLYREKHWSEMKRALRKYDQMGIGPLDIALWDFAGKYKDQPISEMLGRYRDSIPVYASTLGGDRNGGLDSPEAYADFAEECLEMGYPGFKMHMWGGKWRDTQGVIDTVHAVGDRVGDEMDLMLDLSCNLETIGEALKVGRACDEQDFFWYEDPYRDGGVSQHGHRKLRQQLDTPVLQTEMVRSVEEHTDFIAEEATDFVRVDPEYDAGITGAMKITHVAEGFGLDVEYHAPGPAHRQCIGATRNTNYYEMALVHPETDNTTPPIYAGGYDDQLDSIDKNGRIEIPTKPGLGVEYDWDYIYENQTGSIHTYE